MTTIVTASLEAPPGYGYGSSKTYTHSVGLSCVFRQWRATSHCRYLHGYALRVETDYRCEALDNNNWCQDFGALKPLKAWLESTFDHKTLVAKDDPMLPVFRDLAESKFVREKYQRDHQEIPALIQLVIVPSVGVEAFSRMIFDQAQSMLTHTDGRVWVDRVTVSEHEGNSAWYGRITGNQTP